MTYGSILRVWLFSIACTSHVFAAIHTRYSQVTTPAATEPVSFASPSSDGDLVVAIDTNQAATTQPAGDKETLSGFERYLAGLRRLSETVQGMQHDWETLEKVLSSSPGQHGHETNFLDQVQKLFAFAGTTERLFREVMQKYSNDSEVEMRSGGEAQDPSMDSSGIETTSSRSVRAALTATVTDLLSLFEQYFGRQTVNDANVNGEEGREEEVDSLQILVDALEAVAHAHTNYTASIHAVKSSAMANSSTGHGDSISSLPHHSSSSASPEGDSTDAANTTILSAAAWRPLGWHENQRGLLQLAAQLKALLIDNGGDTVPLPTANAEALSTTPSTTTTTTTEKERERPCLPPFEQIAYRMCILQEMQLKLSWSDAQEFCRERGAELAQDMTVIKTRRFLNDLYGEDGTRSRWPVWVGGRRAEQQTWRWSGFADLEVPSFLWAPDEPRTYSRDLMPEGVCMILDGYRRFHGASLPCHLRRRFLCELRN
uniref:C-type lectin n=1 Tax=Portunus trituberculatus TaxID=210409 RepID=A0A290YYB3_PORTR|nr:C-type lectin [Portunus trituberculatus]